MSAKPDAVANAELDAYWGDGTGFQLGLLTAITSGAAGTVTESADASYARQNITLGNAAARQKANTVAVNFPASTGANPAVVGFGIWGGGNLKRIIPVAPSITYTTGYQIIVDIGALVISEAAYA